jgi:hypothetical protein
VITAVDIASSATAGAGRPPRISGVAGFVWIPLGHGAARSGPRHELPLSVGAHAQAELQVTFAEPFCATTLVPATASFLLSVQLRTRAGTTKTVVPSTTVTTTSCTQVLPHGPGPSNPAAARAKVVAAFETVYGPDRTSSDRLARIDDPTGVRAAMQAALAGPYASQAAQATVRVTDLAFDRPDHAWVRYDLGTGSSSPPVGGRLGEARLVGGTWKVTRSTVCADLALAGATCR